MTFEGPLLHTEPAQPQTSVQQKTLNPAWDAAYCLRLGMSSHVPIILGPRLYMSMFFFGPAVRIVYVAN